MVMRSRVNLDPDHPIRSSPDFHSDSVIPARVVGIRILQGLVEIDASGEASGVSTLDPFPVNPSETLKAGTIGVGQAFGPDQSVPELHDPVRLDEALTTSATTSPTRPLNSVRPPQPDMAISSDPGSSSEISF